MTITPLFPSEANEDDELDRIFETFWRAYPRKVAKGAARVSFSKALKLTTPAQLMAAVERFARSPESLPGDPRSIPHAATWLNQTRWQDEPPAPEALIPREPRVAIPPPLDTCGQCANGWLFNDDDTVTRCSCTKGEQ